MRRRYRAQFVEDSASFGKFFEDRVEAIERSAENDYLKGLDSDLRAEFIVLLAKWCEGEGLFSLAKKFFSLERSSSLSMTAVVDELLLLTTEDLLKLNLLHRNVVLGDQEGLTKEHYLPLLSFLSAADGKEERLCCGQVLLALAHASVCVRELKKGMKDMRPVTLGKIEGILERVQTNESELIAGEMLKDVLDSIQLMTDPISEFKRSMEETRRGSRFRRKARFRSKGMETDGEKKVGKLEEKRGVIQPGALGWLTAEVELREEDKEVEEVDETLKEDTLTQSL